MELIVRGDWSARAHLAAVCAAMGLLGAIVFGFI
jgi:hypothetical protein